MNLIRTLIRASAATTAGLAGLLIAGQAQACTCLMPQSAAEQMANAEVVFIGRAERTTMRGDGGRGVTRFVALRTLKGEHREARTVEHHIVDATCGVTFEPDRYVLVIADVRDGRLRTGLCQTPRFDWSDYEATARQTASRATADVLACTQEPPSAGRA